MNDLDTNPGVTELKITSLQALGLGVLATILATLAILYIVVRVEARRGSENPLIVSGAWIAHISVASVNGTPILYSDYASDLKALMTFYASNEFGTPPTKDEASDQVLSRLIGNELVRQAAKELNVELSAEELATTRQNIIAGFDSEQVAKTEIQTRYRWTLDEFVQKVVGPVELEKKLQQTFTESGTTSSTGKTFDAFMTDRLKNSEIKIFGSIHNPFGTLSIPTE